MQKVRVTAKAMDQIPATTAMATASMMQTAMVCATSLKWRAARTQQLVTTTLTQPTTTALASSSTSAAYAAVTVSPTATATATVTCWMSVVCAMVTALPKALATVKGMALQKATTAMATALWTPTAMACATALNRQDVPTPWPATTMQRLRTTTAAAITARAPMEASPLRTTL